MPFSLIPFLLLAVPVAEIAAFIVIGREIGVMWTLACVLVTAAVGTVLLRHQGLSIIARIRAETEAGRLPGRELGDALMIVAAGMLLLTPGFVTDTIGFLLFVPAIRRGLWRFLAARMKVRVVSGEWPAQRGRRPDGQGGGRVVDLDADEFHETGDGKPRDIDHRP